MEVKLRRKPQSYIFINFMDLIFLYYIEIKIFYKIDFRETKKYVN